MYIRNIELRQFRNYTRETIRVQPGINVFFGDNAQGKTNIMEAVYMCACARSHRTARDSELIQHSENFYSIFIEYTNNNGSEESIEISYLDTVRNDPQRSRAMRVVRHNELKLDRISEMMGLFHAVIFAPEDLMIVKEGPSTRRRYIDLLISQIRPSYFLALQNYSRILSQRNRLLKDLREKCQGRKLSEKQETQLDVWDISLAEQAAAILQQRQIFCRKICELASTSHSYITSEKEKLKVKYRTFTAYDPNLKLKEISELYYNKLKSMIYEDIEKGLTTYGPHRDDLELSLNGSGLRSYASQGQQRSTVLSLKMAELEILRQETGESPVLLLDDVMSELDENRRISLLDNIKDAQVFVTCTDPDQVLREIKNERGQEDAGQNRFSFYQVTAGKVSLADEPDITRKELNVI